MVLLYNLHNYELSLPPFSMSSPSRRPLIKFLTFPQISISLHLFYHLTPIIILYLENCKGLFELSGFNPNLTSSTQLI